MVFAISMGLISFAILQTCRALTQSTITILVCFIAVIAVLNYIIVNVFSHL